MIYIILFVLIIIITIVFIFYYHRKLNVKQPIWKLVLNYFFLDYISFIINSIPGIAGLLFRFIYYKIIFKKMGKNVTILENVKFIEPSNISIDDNAGIGYRCFIEATGEVKIGKWVRIGPNVSFFTTNHNYIKKDIKIKHQGYTTGSIIIENDVWIGANVTILPNVKIGEGAVIGAGSIVSKNIDSFTIVAGNPAKVIKYRK